MLRNFQDLLDFTSTSPDDWPGDDEDHRYLVASTNEFIEERGLDWVRANLPMLKDSWRLVLCLF